MAFSKPGSERMSSHTKGSVHCTAYGRPLKENAWGPAQKVIGDMRDLLEGMDGGDEAAGFLDVAKDDRSAPVPRSERTLARLQALWRCEVSLILPKPEQEAHAPSRRGSAPASSSESDNDRHEERSPLRADCWNVRWGAAVGTEGQSPDARSLYEQRVSVHVLRLFSLHECVPERLRTPGSQLFSCATVGYRAGELRFSGGQK